MPPDDAPAAEEPQVYGSVQVDLFMSDERTGKIRRSGSINLHNVSAPTGNEALSLILALLERLEQHNARMRKLYSDDSKTKTPGGVTQEEN